MTLYGVDLELGMHHIYHLVTPELQSGARHHHQPHLPSLQNIYIS